MKSVGFLCLALLTLSLAACSSAESRMARGDDYYISGQYGSALREYQIARRKDPSLYGLEKKIVATQVKILLVRGDEAVDAHEWMEAERCYEEIRTLDAENPEVEGRLERLALARADFHFRNGQDLMAQGNPFDAISEFELALTYHEKHPRAPLALERALREKRDREDRSARAFGEGLDAKRDGRFEDAVRRFDEALELNPYHPGATLELKNAIARVVEGLLEMGDAAMDQQQWDAALSHYGQAASYDATTPGLQHRIARAEREARADELVTEADTALRRGDWRSAYEAFERARCLSSDPDYFLARWQKARNQLAREIFDSAQQAERDGRYEEALAGYQEVMVFYPGYENVAECFEGLGRRLVQAEAAYIAGCTAQEACNLVLARRHFRTCVEAVPGYLDADPRLQKIEQSIVFAENLYRRASDAEAAGKLDRAQILFEECLAITHPFRDVEERLASLASRILEAEEDPFTLYHDACVAQRSRDYERAMRLLSECEGERPGYRDVESRLTEVQRSVERAGEVYEIAVDAEARCELERARELYEECLEVCNPYQDALDRLALLKETLRLYREARRLDRQRMRLAARSRYQEVLDAYPCHRDAKMRLAQLNKVTEGLRVDYQALVEAEENGNFRLALSFALRIRDRCFGYEDVDDRLPRLELEADYQDGCSFQEQDRHELAVRCFERIMKRNPRFRDVQGRLVTSQDKVRRARQRGMR